MSRRSFERFHNFTVAVLGLAIWLIIIAVMVTGCAETHVNADKQAEMVRAYADELHLARL